MENETNVNSFIKTWELCHSCRFIKPDERDKLDPNSDAETRKYCCDNPDQDFDVQTGKYCKGKRPKSDN